MIIYLRHPAHGEKIATLEAEAKADEAKGWLRFDPKAPLSPSPDPVAVQLATIEPKRRGRPPNKAV